MDINDELNNIEALRQFRAEPAPDDQRIKRHFIETCGDVWRLASIAHYALPGMTLHVGLLGVRGGATLRVLHEAADGTLTWGQIIGADNASEGEKPTYGTNPECLAPIMRAFNQITDVVIASKKISDKKKQKLCGQLAHAAEHLMKGA